MTLIMTQNAKVTNARTGGVRIKKRSFWQGFVMGLGAPAFLVTTRRRAEGAAS